MTGPSPDKTPTGSLLASRHGFVVLLSLALLVSSVVVLTRNHQMGRQLVADLVLALGLSVSTTVLAMLLLKLVTQSQRRMSLLAANVTTAIVFVIATATAITGLTFALYTAEITPSPWPDWFQGLLARGSALAIAVALLYTAYMSAHQRARLAAASTQDHKLQALQSRIRPHFLFNSMNSIAGLLKSDPDRAEHALQDLADVFRMLLADARKLVPITVETELARQYLEIEKIRLGDRLHYKWSTSNVPRSAQIPSLTLQPLLENAIYHGIESCFAGGTVNVEMWTRDDNLNILISNPIPEVPTAKHRQGNRIAMDNIRQRLDQHFGDSAQLQAFEKNGIYYVRLTLPVLRG